MAEKRALRTFRMVLWALVVVAAIAASALYFLRPSAINALGSTQFALVDQNGAAVDKAIFTGQPSLLFFGYTNCPDVCPTTLGEMQGWFSTLGDEGKSLKGVFITVDPARDTPEILKGYLSWMDGRVAGLSGPQAEIDKVLRSWGAVGQKAEGSIDDGYLMNHTASVFLVDSKGQFFGTIAYEEATDTAIAKIRRLLAAS